MLYATGLTLGFGAKVPIVLPNNFLCVQQKKETHSDLQQLEGGCVNDDRILIYGWSIPFTFSLLCLNLMQ